MPDASSHRPFHDGPPPSGWGEAFAALPPEAPPAGGWERIARALPVRRRHRWPAWVALAAALALVAIVPLRWSRPDVPATTTAPARVAAAQPAPAPAEPVAAAGDAASPSSIATDASGEAAAVASAAREPGSAPVRSTEPAAATQPDTGTAANPQLAAVDTPRQESIEPPATPSELERLYAESAQLEGLLALARDGGEVANGAVAMLSDDLATRVARIDAALMQPALAGERRVELWRERVEALRQAAAFESTQRLLAARGEQYDAMLVSID